MYCVPGTVLDMVHRVLPFSSVQFSRSVVSDLFATPWTVALQAPLPMGCSRLEYWSELPCPSPRDLPDPGMEPASPALAGGFFTAEPPRKPKCKVIGPKSQQQTLGSP